MQSYSNALIAALRHFARFIPLIAAIDFTASRIRSFFFSFFFFFYCSFNTSSITFALLAYPIDLYDVFFFRLVSIRIEFVFINVNRRLEYGDALDLYKKNYLSF